MTNGISFLKELTAKLDKRPRLALLWSLLWMLMMLALKFDGMLFVVLLLILFMALDLTTAYLFGDVRPERKQLIHFVLVSLLSLSWRGMPFVFRALSQISVPIAIQNEIFDHRRQFVFLVVCGIMGVIWLFCSVSDEAVGVFFSKKIKRKHLFLRILLLETEFIFWSVFLFSIGCWLCGHMVGNLQLIWEMLILMLKWFLLIFYQMACFQLYFGNRQFDSRVSGISGAVTICFLIAAFAQLVFVKNSLVPNLQSDFKIVAHRGSDGNNGVPNTVPTLKNSKKKLSPDYSELDVRQTVDGRFVVIHDAMLTNSSGKECEVNNLSLGDLIERKVKESGHVAYLSGYSQYLEAAHQIKQPLITEIKTDDHDNYDLAAEFCHLYADSMIDHGDMVHSMDYRIIANVKKSEKRLKCGYVLPFEIFSMPKGAVDFYSIESLTMNRSFIKAAHDQKKKVYVWTVNNKLDCLRACAIGADGVITDNGSKLKHVLKTATKDDLSLGCFINSYATLK